MEIQIQSDRNGQTTFTEFNPNLLDPEAAEHSLRETAAEIDPLDQEESEAEMPADEMGPALGVLIAAGLGGGWWTVFIAAVRSVG